MNWYGLKAIYLHEMDRMRRTLFQSLVSPIISTSLYFIVFGSAIGSRIKEIEGVSYGSFIVPGMIMLTILTQSISNASFGIFFPKFYRFFVCNRTWKLFNIKSVATDIVGCKSPS